MGSFAQLADEGGRNPSAELLGRLEMAHSQLEDVSRSMRTMRRIKWSTSDVSCWMDEAEFQELLMSLARASTDGSRICARDFAAYPADPSQVSQILIPDHALARKISEQDSSALFPLCVFSIARGARSLQ